MTMIAGKHGFTPMLRRCHVPALPTVRKAARIAPTSLKLKLASEDAQLPAFLFHVEIGLAPRFRSLARFELVKLRRPRFHFESRLLQPGPALQAAIVTHFLPFLVLAGRPPSLPLAREAFAFFGDFIEPKSLAASLAVCLLSIT